MSLRRVFARSLAFAGFALIATAAQGCASESGVDESQAHTAGAQTATRPPQFVLFAFDGSFNNAFWQESRSFAKETQAELQKKARETNPRIADKDLPHLKFTYFVNPSYYIARKNSTNRQYTAPPVTAPRVGSSAIGFGDNSNNPGATLDDIKQRLEQTAMARAEGNEIGSHAVGHFDGSTWSRADWDSEFTQFNDIFFSAARSAGFPEVNLGFDKSDLVGFRAPQLGHSPGLYSVLAENAFKYDTSRVAQPNHWPRKDEAGNQGVWNFALASLKIQGSGGSAGKNTLSMDYNFYFADSKGVTDPNPANFAIHERNMLETYRAYFAGNYYGNRAPLQIGHHFSKWNGGAYWNAMQKFANEICGLPEVQCVTHKEVVAFLEDAHDHGSLPDYQAGAFPKLPRPPGDDAVDVAAPIDEKSMARESAHDDSCPEGQTFDHETEACK